MATMSINLLLKSAIVEMFLLLQSIQVLAKDELSNQGIPLYIVRSTTNDNFY
jgi:hypothetical protein